MNNRVNIWKGLLAVAMLIAMVSTAFAVTEADVIRLKDKVARGEELTAAERHMVQEAREQFGSEIEQTDPRTFENPRQPNRPLDVYLFEEIDYEWFDVLATAQPTGLANDDQNLGPFDIGFSFPYYDQTYTQFRVCSNGYITFGSTSTIYTNTAIPAAAEPNGAIYVFWDDLYLPFTPDDADSIYYYFDDANDRLVVTFDSVGHIGATAERYKAQIVLYPNGNIQLNYALVATGGTYGNMQCTVGIENQTGTEALQVCFNGTGTLPETGMSIMISQPDGVPNPPTNVVATVNGSDVTFTWDDPTTDTNGNPLTPDGIQVWQGPAGTGTLLGTVGAGVETFTANGLQAGNYTFNLRATSTTFFSASSPVLAVVGNPSYFSDFETDDGELVALSDSGWAWGVPTAVGPAAAHSGVNLWGTYLNANYPSNACYMLDLDQELTVASDAATLEFWMWFDTELTYDGMNIKVSTDGGATWEVVTDVSPAYTVQAISTLNECMVGEPAWSGHNGGSWTYYTVNLGAYVGMTPIIRFAFSSDDIINYPGMYIDDVILWGFGEPEFASVAGTITFDGQGGTMTSVNVRANGIGNPSVHPAANGTYTLPTVLLGNRIVSADLAGFHTASTNIVLTNAGATGVNLTLVRVDPPVPTGLDGDVANATGVVTLDWDNSPDPYVDVYPVYRRLQGETDWVLQGSPTTSSYTQTLTVAGIYEYAVAARDNNVSTPVESDMTDPITVLYGALPPTGLAANGNYDDRIVLTWFSPGTPPEFEIYYDSVDVDPTCVEDGLGFNSQFPFAWFAGHYQGTGAITINRIKTRHWPNSAPGCPVQYGVFEDDGTGLPTFEPLGVTDWTIEDPLAWQDVALETPVTVTSGSFFVGIRQMTAQRVDIGMDFCAAEQTNTFFATTANTGPWTELGSAGFPQVLVMRAFVIGNMGAAMELSPSPVGVLSESHPVADADFLSYANQTAEVKTVVGKGKAAKAVEQVANVSFVPRSTKNYTGSPIPVLTNRTALTERDPGGALDEILYYIVYRDNVDIAHPIPTVLTYTDLGRTENVVYHYTVLAHYDDGQNSVRDSVDAMCNMAPAAPTALVVNPLGTTQMVLAWVAPAQNADGTNLVDLGGYRVYRNGTQIGTTGAGVTTYTDTPPDPQMFYTWTVSAVDEVPNVSAPSNDAIGAVVSPWEVYEYEWVDITGVGTAAGIANDDQNVGPFDLGFTVEYYGQTYSSVRMCSNGWASFTSTSTAYTNVTIPNVAEPNNGLFCFWDDLYPPDGGEFYYYQDVANDRFIMSWVDVPHISNDAALLTFQIIITADGGIIYNYHTIPTDATPNNTSCTVGVENSAGDEAIEVYFNAAGAFAPASETSVAFWAGPSGAVAGLVREFGTNLPIQNAEVWVVENNEFTVTDATGNYSMSVEPGTYTLLVHKQGYCDVEFTNVVVDDGGTTTRNASMRQPNATFNVTSLNIFAQIGQDGAGSFEITNPGATCEVAYDVTSNQTWLTVDHVSGEVAENQSQIIFVTADVSAFPVGDYEATLTVNHNDVGAPYEIPVTVTVSVDADEHAALPTVFALHANYPNPFNASTSLNFDVPTESRVQITIYNVQGQEVARPVDAVLAAGNHRVIYSASDLPTGMYLVKMTAADFTAVQKIVLLK